jgi:hypothetical protein
VSRSTPDHPEFNAAQISCIAVSWLAPNSDPGSTAESVIAWTRRGWVSLAIPDRPSLRHFELSIEIWPDVSVYIKASIRPREIPSDKTSSTLKRLAGTGRWLLEVSADASRCRSSCTCCSTQLLAGLSMRTPGGEVVRGRWDRPQPDNSIP